MSKEREQFAGNLDYWEQAAASHGTTAGDTYYDLDRVIAGGTLMTEYEEAALALATGAPADAPLSKLAGLDVLHLQSHIGVDGVVMARAGARVTCADFSPTALGRALDLAAKVGVEIDVVECDARALPESLYGRFDVVYVTIGALCWIDDHALWMQQVSLALRPGGRLVMLEMHPLFNMLESRVPDLIVDLPYSGGGFVTMTGEGTYSDPASTINSTTTCYAYSIGEVVTGAVRAGLVVDRLEEHTSLAFNPRGDATAQVGDDGRYRILLGRGTRPEDAPQPLPMVFTFVATKQ